MSDRQKQGGPARQRALELKRYVRKGTRQAFRRQPHQGELRRRRYDFLVAAFSPLEGR